MNSLRIIFNLFFYTVLSVTLLTLSSPTSWATKNETSLLSQSIYQIFNLRNHTPGDPAIQVPRSLSQYTEALVAHHKLATQVAFEFVDNPQDGDSNADQLRYEPIPRSVLVPFTGGIDSTALALKLKEEGWNVHLLYIDNLNNAHNRERVAAQVLAEKIGLLEHLTILEHHESKNIPRKNAVIELLENPAKNQYIWLAALETMKKLRCEKISFAIQNDEHDRGAYFSDNKNAFHYFNEYITQLLGRGDSILFPSELSHPLDTKTSYMKYLMEKCPDCYRSFSSCCKQGGRFKQSQIKNELHLGRVSTGICGSSICSKCSKIKKIMIEEKFNPEIWASVEQPKPSKAAEERQAGKKRSPEEIEH